MMIIILKKKNLRRKNLARKTWICKKKTLRLGELKNKNMAYERQLQMAMEKLDGALAQLRNLIKRGDNKGAIHFMEEGALKERYEELQNMITISQTNGMGSRGTANGPGMF
jgi:hypothetical protein